MVVVKEQFSTETIRHLATFLTATLCQGRLLFFCFLLRGIQYEHLLICLNGVVVEPTLTSSALPTSDAQPSSFIFDASAIKQGNQKSSLHILHLLHDFLLAPDREVELEKFGKIITTKWMLLFSMSTIYLTKLYDADKYTCCIFQSSIRKPTLSPPFFPSVS